MSVDWQARWQRERQARMEAESLLEDRSEALYEANRQLNALNRRQGQDLQLQQKQLERRRYLGELLNQAGLILLQGKMSTPVTTVMQLQNLLEEAELPFCMRWGDNVLPQTAKDLPWASLTTVGTLSPEEPILEQLNAHSGYRLLTYEHQVELLFYSQTDELWGEIEQGFFQTILVMCEAFFQNIIAYRKLKKAEQDTLEMAKVRGRFLAMVTHELRTPLNGLLAGAELLYESPLDQGQKELLTIIKHSGENLLALVNDILDFSKIDDQGFVLHPESIELHDLAKTTLGLVENLAQEKALPLALHWQGQTPCWVSLDALRLRQILLNLLSNAIKFTEQGQIQLEITVEDTEPYQVHFCVRDSGQGIDPEYQKHLFDPFYQAPGTQQGTGLGLAICHRLCSSMQGELKVHSVVGQGSCFTFSLPLEASEPVSIEQAADQTKTNSGQILLVEDTKANQIVASLMLKKAGYHVVLAENGKQALEQYQPERFDLVLMDCRMPVMDGFECTKALRQRGALEPIIALTATTTDEGLAHCLSCGMNDVMTKPLRKATLLGKLNQWLMSETKAS